MKKRPVLFIIISAFIFCYGCATLPEVSEVMQDVTPGQEPPQIKSARGVLSPKHSKAIIDRLKQSVAPTDLLERQMAVIEAVTDSPLIKGNRVELLIDGPATYAAMFRAVENAKDNINMETFIFDYDKTGQEFADLLLKKQSEGVRVNVIYDSVGSYGTPASFFKKLRDGGIQVLEYNPVNPLKARGKLRLKHRDHRKILVVDGKVAITGGVNISQVYSGRLSPGEGGEDKAGSKAYPWRDTDIQIEGPAVAEFQKLFLETWRRQKGPALPAGDYLPDLKEVGKDLVQVVGSTPGQMNRITFIMYVSAVTFSENAVHMTNSYFVPDEQTMTAVTDAARRGVDVRIILPGMSDSPLAFYAGRYYYSDLLKAGVKLYARRTAPLHAKTAVIDGVWSTVGSTNLDFWSFLNNDEVNAIILSRDFANEMEKMFARDLEESDEITLDEWRKRPLWPRIREWVSHLFAHWL